MLIGENDLITSEETFVQAENQSGYKIVFAKVSSLKNAEEAINTLKESSCQIQALWIRAHGTPNSISFSESVSGLDMRPSCCVDTQTEKFLGTVDQTLEKEAPIILESCHTGSKMADGEENIATVIARIAKRKTYAPSREALSIEKGVSYSKEESRFKVVIEGSKSSKSFKQGSICSRIMGIWHFFMKRRENITCEFLPPEG